MIEINKNDLIKYALGIIILLIFILILGIYLFFLSRLQLGVNNGAGVLLAGQQNDDLNQRLSSVQNEIDLTLARVRELENQGKKPVTPAVVTPAAPAPKYLKISKFTASQMAIPSGSQVTFSYAAENTARGVSYRLLLQCPLGVMAIYSNGANVCRRTIAEALPIDNSGSYTVTFSNNSSESGVVIAVLLASDITDNAIFFRDSRVLTMTVMPSGYSGVPAPAPSLTLTSSPTGAPAPATISFTATLNDIQTCYQSHWEFGDGVSSENFAVCPSGLASVRARTIFETHQYNQPGTYTATLFAGDKRASNTIYVSAATSWYSAPSQYASVYTYSIPQPVYNYVYTPTPTPIYNYNLPSLPDVPTVPTNFRAVASNNNGIILSWSAPAYGNVISYTIYRKGGSTLNTPINGSPSVCGNSSANICYYTVSGNLSSFTDANVSAGDTYTYRIVAGNAYGSSNFSDSLTVSLAESNSPTVPRTFTATVNGGRIILNWSAPASGNVSNYTIYRKGGGSLLVPITVSVHSCNSGDLGLCYYFASGTTFTLTDTNLVPNTAYTYRIIATNPFGTSEYSDSLTVISGQIDPPISTPTLNPANRVDGIGATQLSWNSVGANYYRVLRSANPYDAAPSNEDLVPGCTTATTNLCFVLVSGDDRIYSLQTVDSRYDITRSNYYYRVKAYGTNGASNWSNEVAAAKSTVLPPLPVVTINFGSTPVIPFVSSDGATNVMCQTSNAISVSRLRVYTTDTFGRDRRNCDYTWADVQGGVYRYRFGCYASNSRSTVDGSVLLGSPRIFTCEEVDTNGNPLDPANSRSITRNCAAGDAGVSGGETMCNGTVITPPVDPVITNFTIDGQTAPSYTSGASANLSYAGTNVASYKLFVQCPANMSVVDTSSANICRTSANDAVSISSTGSYRIALYNMGSSAQVVNVSLLALRANGSVSHSVSRLVSINPAAVPPPAPDPVITSFTVDGQTAPTAASGVPVNLAYSGTNVASYKLYVQCPANVSVPNSTNTADICLTNANEAITIPSNGSYSMAIFNMNSGDRLVTATIMAMRSNGSLSNSITRTITVHPQPGL